MEETRKPARKPSATTTPKSAGKAPAKSAAPVKAPAPRKAATTAKPARPARRTSMPTAQEREQMVRMAAYFRAQQRGFAPGNEWEDWLVAEAEIGALVETPAAPVPRKAPARKTPKA